MQPCRLLMLGDSHCSYGHIKWAVERAKANKCDVIVQLGDFGYWPHEHDGVVFLNRVVELLRAAKMTLYFIDGNHENFTMLWDDHPEIDCFRRVWTSDRLLYMPRGTRWEWCGKTFLALGGAPSIDKDWRLAVEKAPRTAWWTEEEIRPADCYKAVEDGPVDIMIAHDAPAEAHIPIPKIDFPAGEAHRKLLSQVIAEVKPKKYYHGHYHAKYGETIQYEDFSMRVVGLAHNERMRESYAICDLQTDTF